MLTHPNRMLLTVFFHCQLVLKAIRLGSGRGYRCRQMKEISGLHQLAQLVCFLWREGSSVNGCCPAYPSEAACAFKRDPHRVALRHIRFRVKSTAHEGKKEHYPD